MKFEKYLFSIEINGNVVEKYSDDEKIVLMHKRGGKLQKKMTFENAEEYEAAIDSVVSDDDAVYNKANALNDVLKAFFNTDLS